MNFELKQNKFRFWLNYVGVFSLFVIVESSWADAPGARINQPAQIFEYVISYLNVPSTRLQIAVYDTILNPGQRYHQIQVQAKTYGLFSSLFYVTNRYTTLIDPTTGLPIIFSKQVHQKNIQQAWTIVYDQNQHLAVIDSARSWQIPSNCHTYFSMLCFLRARCLASGATDTLNLDVENLSYQVHARVKKKSGWI